LKSVLIGVIDSRSALPTFAFEVSLNGLTTTDQ